MNLGNVEIDAGNLDRASQVLQEALTLRQEQGNVVGVANAGYRGAKPPGM